MPQLLNVTPFSKRKRVRIGIVCAPAFGENAYNEINSENKTIGFFSSIV